MESLEKLVQLKLHSAVSLFEGEMKAIRGSSGTGGGSGNPIMPYRHYCRCRNGRTFAVNCNINNEERCCTIACNLEKTGGSGWSPPEEVEVDC